MEKMKKFSEDWQISKQSICERGKYLLENPVWSDCKFLVGIEEPYVKEFEAHKLFLSISSPVFATMFYGGLPEIQSHIRIVDVQPEAFKSMLEYIYTDAINLESLDQACELCYVAKKYMLPHLLEHCIQFIWKDVDNDTALKAYEFAKLFDDPMNSSKAMKIICEQTTDILSKAGALNMNLATLIDILDQEELNISSELYLFNVLQSWVMFNINKNDDDDKYDEEKLKSLAKPGLQRIRFLAMDISDFADGPAESPLLTKDESYAIFKKLSSFHNKHPLPEGFSTVRTPRINPSKKVVNLQNKLYVQREIKTPVLQMNNSTLKDSLHFIANEDITLLGVQIPTQIRYVTMNTSSDDSSLYVYHSTYSSNAGTSQDTSRDKFKYRELLIMHVKEIRNSENSWFTHFTSLVEHNSVMNVMFTTPAVIKRGYEYELGVSLNKEGYYMIGSFDHAVEKYADNVQFIVSGNSNSAFVTSLIFTH
ncbi:BTB/POZ domain-containing protein 2 [Planococcus citri]|uniref:BTB/POZ domain-containing protein 2 n=1 Tax=Planococcus citri TaxID=170843 RepID=UPI0031FA1A10